MAKHTRRGHRSRKPNRTPQNSGTRNPASWFLDWFHGGHESDSGLVVTGETALHYQPVWQAVNVIAGDLAQLPLEILQHTPDGKQIALTQPGYRLLRRRPNSMMSAGTFKELLQSHALLWGNGRAGIVRDFAGKPTALIPFLPDRSEEVLIEDQLFHLTRLGTSQTMSAFADRDVLHIKGLGFDGLTGHSIISLARNSWGLGMACEKHGNRLFKNNARPSVILESDGTFTAENAKQLLRDWEAMHAGLDNSGKTALLQQGTKANVLTMSNTDAEFMATRKYQRVEVAGWFKLPPHKVGDDSRLSYNSLEQENQAYIDSCLMRWLCAWEEECHEKLLSEADKASEQYFVSFDTSALLRGDLTARYASYQIGIANEFLSPNDVRAKENMNKRADGKGDVYRNPNRADPKPPGAAATPAADGSRQLIVGRLQGMFGVERRRVLDAAEKSKNFCDWLDTFYDGWQKRFSQVLTEVGGDAAMAGECINDHKAELLDVAGRATPAQFVDRVAEQIRAWPRQAEKLADEILADQFLEQGILA